MINIKYHETRTLRWTTGRRSGEYEKVKNLNKATCFLPANSKTQLALASSDVFALEASLRCLKTFAPHNLIISRKLFLFEKNLQGMQCYIVNIV